MKRKEFIRIYIRATFNAYNNPSLIGLVEMNATLARHGFKPLSNREIIHFLIERKE